MIAGCVGVGISVAKAIRKTRRKINFKLVVDLFKICEISLLKF